MAEFNIPKVLNLEPVPSDAASGASKAKAYAMTVVVNSQDGYEMAANEVAGIKARWNKMDEMRKFFVEPLNKIVKSYNDFFRQPLADLAEAESIIKRTMITYKEAEDRRAEELRKVKAEEAEKKRLEFERQAREERAKHEAIEQRARDEEARMTREREESERQARDARERELAAKRRGDEEAERRAKEDRQRAEALRKEQEEAERKARSAAEKAAQEANDREQTAIENARAVQALPPVELERPKAAGTSSSKRWKTEIINANDFYAALSDGRIPRTAAPADLGVLNRMAQAAGGQITLPGVRVYPDNIMSVKAKG